MLWRVRDILEVIAPALQLGGLCDIADIKKALDAYNRINEIVMMRDDFPGTEADVEFTTLRGCLTLPSQFGAITALRVGGVATRILPSGFEYLEAGPGPIRYDRDASVLQFLGDRFCTFTDLASPLHIGCWSDQKETAAVLRIYGTDDQGRELRVNGVPGLPLNIIQGTAENRPDATVIRVAHISAVVKTITAGHVELFGYEPATGAISWLSRLGPHETAPSLTRYMLPGISATAPLTVRARVSLQFTPLYALDDISLIQQREPYRLMAQALRCFDAEDGATGSEYQNRAMKMLKGAVAKKTKGQRQTLNISMTRRPVRNGRFYSAR